MTTLVSKQTHDVFKIMQTLYELRMSDPVSQHFLSLATSQDCKNVFTAGHSLGGSLAQLFRIDLGDVNEAGKYTDTCLGGKPCFYFGFCPLGCLWFGRVPEFVARSNKTVMMWYETDPVQTLLQRGMLGHRLEVRDRVKSEGISELVDPKNMMIKWRFRDLVFFDLDTPMRRAVFEHELNQSAWDFQSSPMFTQRLHQIVEFGEIVSFRFCPYPMAGKILLKMQAWCDHSSGLLLEADHIKFEDEPREREWNTKLSNPAIPDLPSSAINSIIRLLVVLGVVEE